MAVCLFCVGVWGGGLQVFCLVRTEGLLVELLLSCWWWVMVVGEMNAYAQHNT